MLLNIQEVAMRLQWAMTCALAFYGDHVSGYMWEGCKSLYILCCLCMSSSILSCLTKNQQCFAISFRYCSWIQYGTLFSGVHGWGVYLTWVTRGRGREHNETCSHFSYGINIYTLFYFHIKLSFSYYAQQPCARGMLHSKTYSVLVNVEIHQKLMVNAQGEESTDMLDLKEKHLEPSCTV